MAYKSISEAIIHAGVHTIHVRLCRMDTFRKNKYSTVKEKLKNLSGILVAPGFGDRGMENCLN